MTAVLDQQLPAHGTLAAPLTAAIELPRTAEAVAAGRHWLVKALKKWGVPKPVRETAELLLSELETNAVEHAIGDGNSTVTAAWWHGDLRVTVSDPDPRCARGSRATPGLDDTGGRGLFLVESLADRYGSTPVPDGKITWFELNGTRA